MRFIIYYNYIYIIRCFNYAGVYTRGNKVIYSGDIGLNYIMHI